MSKPFDISMLAEAAEKMESPIIATCKTAQGHPMTVIVAVGVQAALLSKWVETGARLETIKDSEVKL